MVEWVSFSGQALLAVLAIGAGQFLPGRLFLRLGRVRVTALERFVLSLVTGAGMLALVYWSLSWLGVPQGLWIYVVGASGLEGVLTVRRRPHTPSTVLLHGEPAEPFTTRFAWPLALLVLAGVLLQTRFMLWTGWPSAQGLSLLAWHGHDAPWHVFLIDQLARVFPPEVPGFAHTPLVNYHMFADLLWGAVGRLAQVSPWHLYFRIAPVWYSGLLMLTVFITGRAWTGRSATGALAAALTLFTGGLGYLLPLVFGPKGYFIWDSIFWVSSPLMNIFNPGVSAGHVFLLAGVWALIRWDRERDWGALALVALCWGVLPGFKVYTGLVALAGLAAAGVAQSLFQRRSTYLAALAAVLPVFLIVFLPPNLHATSLVRLMPGFNLATMLAAPDRMAIMTTTQLKFLTAEHPGVMALLILAALAIFVVGNLGTRAIALPSLVRAVRDPRQADPVLLFITGLLAAALGGAVLFVQTGLQWNTIQFFYPAVVITGIPAAEQFWLWARSWSPTRRRVALAVLFALGLPCIVQALWVVNYSSRSSAQVLDAMTWLRRAGSREEVVLRPLPEALMTDEGYEEWKYILERGRMTKLSAWRSEAGAIARGTLRPRTLPAATGRPEPLDRLDAPVIASLALKNTYLEDTMSARIQGHPVEQRVEEVRRFYLASNVAEARKFLQEAGITYLLCTPDRPLPFDPQGVPLDQVYANPELIIYKYAPPSGVAN